MLIRREAIPRKTSLSILATVLDEILDGINGPLVLVTKSSGLTKRQICRPERSTAPDDPSGGTILLYLY